MTPRRVTERICEGSCSWEESCTPWQPAKRSTAILVAIGLIASLAGLLIPQMLPGDKADAAPTASVHDMKDLTYVPPTWPEPPSVQSLMLRLGFGTMFVLVLSVAAIWYGKRYLTAYAGGSLGGELKLVETLPLGNRCRLHLVRLGGRQILVGADGAGIKTVTPLDEFEQVLADRTAEPIEPTREAALKQGVRTCLIRPVSSRRWNARGCGRTCRRRCRRRCFSAVSCFCRRPWSA